MKKRKTLKEVKEEKDYRRKGLEHQLRYLQSKKKFMKKLESGVKQYRFNCEWAIEAKSLDEAMVKLVRYNDIMLNYQLTRPEIYPQLPPKTKQTVDGVSNFVRRLKEGKLKGYEVDPDLPEGEYWVTSFHEAHKLNLNIKEAKKIKKGKAKKETSIDALIKELEEELKK